jgi:hypothetical protein
VAEPDRVRFELCRDRHNVAEPPHLVSHGRTHRPHDGIVQSAIAGGTAFIPSATGTLGAYPALLPATLLYGIVLTYCSTVYNVMLAHVIRGKSIDPSAAPATIRQTVRSYRFGWGTYAIATLVGFVPPIASFAPYVLIVGYCLIPHGVDADIEKRARSA